MHSFLNESFLRIYFRSEVADHNVISVSRGSSVAGSCGHLGFEDSLHCLSCAGCLSCILTSSEGASSERCGLCGVCILAPLAQDGLWVAPGGVQELTCLCGRKHAPWACFCVSDQPRLRVQVKPGWGLLLKCRGGWRGTDARVCL